MLFFSGHLKTLLYYVPPACIAVFYIIIYRAVGDLDFLIMYSRISVIGGDQRFKNYAKTYFAYGQLYCYWHILILITAHNFLITLIISEP